ncbi:MAG TPA: hypothetical protein ENH86_01115, partial [Candidatus Jorgensenbacteria bacterium]|nr:hypothetical protein [Candidatus Jorgensenbacteria bacterium]
MKYFVFSLLVLALLAPPSLMVLADSHTITITSPLLNERWELEKTYKISWQGSEPGIDTVSIILVNDRGGRTKVH